MNMKSMSIDKLSRLQMQVKAALASKVADERNTLEAELAKLSRIAIDGARSRGLRGSSRGRVAAKYRNPQNPSETWAGRGLKPRWLTAAMKGGKKLEYFSIARLSAKGASKKAINKTRKVKGSAKK